MPHTPQELARIKEEAASRRRKEDFDVLSKHIDFIMESYSNFSYFYIHPKDRIELYRAASDEVVLSEIRKAYAKVGWIVKFTKDESDGEVKVTVVEKESNE